MSDDPVTPKPDAAEGRIANPRGRRLTECAQQVAGAEIDPPGRRRGGLNRSTFRAYMFRGSPAFAERDVRPLGEDLRVVEVGRSGDLAIVLEGSVTRQPLDRSAAITGRRPNRSLRGPAL
jgi:hypothetical protein